MTLSAWLSPIVALLGVAVGGLVSRLNQDRDSKRVESRRLHADRQAVYVRFLVAVRDYRTYITRPDAAITVFRDSHHRIVRPAFGADGAPFKQAVARAYAELALVATGHEVVEAAALLARTVRRLAVAQAMQIHGPVHELIDASIWRAEGYFLELARTDLGLTTMSTARHPEVNLEDIDRDLFAAFAAAHAEATNQTAVSGDLTTLSQQSGSGSVG